MTHRTNGAIGVRRKYMFEFQVGIIGQTRNRRRREQYCLKLYPPLSMRFVLYDVLIARCL